MRLSLLAVQAALLASCTGSGQSGNVVEDVAIGDTASTVNAAGQSVPRRRGAPSEPARSTENDVGAANDGTPQVAKACQSQGGKTIPPNRLKAIGTEPFWAARIEGRCVTYMTPENQQGTRIWTAFTGIREAGQWIGILDKQRFALRTRPEPGCSDGMSDQRYPIAVTLVIGNEERTGCAEPI